jgi:hypothetical protein
MDCPGGPPPGHVDKTNWREFWDNGIIEANQRILLGGKGQKDDCARLVTNGQLIPLAITLGGMELKEVEHFAIIGPKTGRKAKME